ncbi:MAG: PHP domain-containing protein [Clostridia bacterium]|nr:PHP domain-containing protein [Clostridia bacterium]
MERKYLLPQEGQFYKANLHSHCTESDGHLTPEEAKEAYKAKGYQIYAFSDHRKIVPHPELKDENFLPITSLEFDVKDMRDPDRFDKPTYHLNFFSKDEMRTKFVPYDWELLKTQYRVEDINDVIRRANEAGFLAQYNHPRWSCQDVRDFGGLEGLWGFEVINGECHSTKMDGWGDVEFHQMCCMGKFLCPTGSDDNHNCHPFDDPNCGSFKGWTMIKAPSLTYDAVLTAMEKGNLYATTGPEIKELYIEDGKVHMKTTPAKVLLLRTEYRPHIIQRAFDDSLTHAVFDLSKFKKQPNFIRFEVWDSHNEKAMTRAYLPEEFQF